MIFNFTHSGDAYMVETRFNHQKGEVISHLLLTGQGHATLHCVLGSDSNLFCCNIQTLSTPSMPPLLFFCSPASRSRFLFQSELQVLRAHCMTVCAPLHLLWQYMTRPIKQTFLHQKQAELHSIQRGGLEDIFVHLYLCSS